MALKMTYDNPDEFNDRVGVLDFEDLLDIGFDPLPICASVFHPNELERAKAFIRVNPAYHIVTTLPYKTFGLSIKINDLVEGPTHRTYRLADGDSDPTLACATTSNFWIKWRESLEEALAERSLAKGRDDDSPAIRNFLKNMLRATGRPGGDDS